MCPLILCFIIVSHELSDDRTYKPVDPQISPQIIKNRCLISKVHVLGHKARFKMLCIGVNNSAVSSLRSSRA